MKQTSIWRLHRIVGTLLFGVFLFTGFYMKFNWGGIDQSNLLMRSVFRSRHLLILMSALLHLLVGRFGQLSSVRWRQTCQKSGSVFMLVGSVAFIGAFFHDPYRQAVFGSWGEAGVFLMLAGCLAHIFFGPCTSADSDLK